MLVSNANGCPICGDVTHRRSATNNRRVTAPGGCPQQAPGKLCGLGRLAFLRGQNTRGRGLYGCLRLTANARVFSVLAAPGWSAKSDVKW